MTCVTGKWTTENEPTEDNIRFQVEDISRTHKQGNTQVI